MPYHVPGKMPRMMLRSIFYFIHNVSLATSLVTEPPGQESQDDQSHSKDCSADEGTDGAAQQEESKYNAHCEEDYRCNVLIHTRFLVLFLKGIEVFAYQFFIVFVIPLFQRPQEVALELTPAFLC